MWDPNKTGNFYDALIAYVEEASFRGKTGVVEMDTGTLVAFRSGVLHEAVSGKGSQCLKQ